MGTTSARRATLYIGTYTGGAQQGICCAPFDLETGELGAARTVAAISNPSFLATSPDGGCLYAVNEWGQVAGGDVGGLSAFRIEKATGELFPLREFAQAGILCHLTVDATGKWLLVCAYGAGTVSTWQILPDGNIGECVALVQHQGRGVDEKRQSGPHAHHLVLSPDNRRAFVADLGLDRLMAYEFDAGTGSLAPEESPFMALPGGAGPRHLALTPSGEFLYVVSELSNTVTVFRNEPDGFQPVQTISTLPADFAGQSFTAEIAVHPGRRFLYVSNRGHDSLTHYAIEADGQLELVGFISTGRNPRHFTFDAQGRWLLVANQSDYSISVFAVEPSTGTLTQKHQLEGVPGQPTCLLLSQTKAFEPRFRRG